jgi:hypothetical protein
LEQYFTNQPDEIDGVIQKKYFILETIQSVELNGSSNRKWEVLGILHQEISTLSDKYVFVQMVTDTMPVFTLKENV